MAIQATCQKCGRQYRVKSQYGGKRFKCKTGGCHGAVVVPLANLASRNDSDRGNSRGEARKRRSLLPPAWIAGVVAAILVSIVLILSAEKDSPRTDVLSDQAVNEDTRKIRDEVPNSDTRGEDDPRTIAQTEPRIGVLIFTEDGYAGEPVQELDEWLIAQLPDDFGELYGQADLGALVETELRHFNLQVLSEHGKTILATFEESADLGGLLVIYANQGSLSTRVNGPSANLYVRRNNQKHGLIMRVEHKDFGHTTPEWAKGTFYRNYYGAECCLFLRGSRQPDVHCLAVDQNQTPVRGRPRFHEMVSVLLDKAAPQLRVAIRESSTRESAATRLTQSDAPETGPPKIDHELTYFVVREDVNRYIGRRVAWVARQATYSTQRNVTTGERTTTYVYLAAGSNSRFYAENPFIFSYTGESAGPKRTVAADKLRNTPGPSPALLVIGTIEGAASWTDIDGKSQKVPELVDVVLDAPAELGSERVGAPPSSDRPQKETAALGLLGRAASVTAQAEGSIEEIAAAFSLAQDLANSKERIAEWLTRMKYENTVPEGVSGLVVFALDSCDIADVQHILGAEDGKEVGTIEFKAETLSVTWRRYGWLKFGAVGGKVVLVQASFKERRIASQPASTEPKMSAIQIRNATSHKIEVLISFQLGKNQGRFECYERPPHRGLIEITQSGRSKFFECELPPGLASIDLHPDGKMAAFACVLRPEEQEVLSLRNGQYVVRCELRDALVEKPGISGTSTGRVLTVDEPKKWVVTWNTLSGLKMDVER